MIVNDLGVVEMFLKVEIPQTDCTRPCIVVTKPESYTNIGSQESWYLPNTYILLADDLIDPENVRLHKINRKDKPSIFRLTFDCKEESGVFGVDIEVFSVSTVESIPLP